MRNLTHKLVYRSDPTDADHSSELYDLVADPYELRNLYVEPSAAQVPHLRRNGTSGPMPRCIANW